MRLVTRGDLDGLDVRGPHHRLRDDRRHPARPPQDITDKKVPISAADILANLPYHPACGKWFDHHLLTESNERPPERLRGPLRPRPLARRAWSSSTTSRSTRCLKKYETPAGRDRPPRRRPAHPRRRARPPGTTSCSATPSTRAPGSGPTRTTSRSSSQWLHNKPIEEIMASCRRCRSGWTRMREQDQAFREATVEALARWTATS